jgi:hypothetical protein
MARNVFTVSIYANAMPVGATSIYTVPVGFVFVLRDVDMTNNGASNDIYSILDFTANIFIVKYLNVPPDTSVQWCGRQPFVAGEQIGLESALGIGNARVSGYLLVAP